MSKEGTVDLALWIVVYQNYLESSGYAVRTMRRRLKHLACLKQFAQSEGLTSLEEFRPEQAVDFIEYWVHHGPAAKSSVGLTRPSRFQPRHHIGVQYSLRSFFRWARGAGYLERDLFPLRAPVRGHSFFPEVAAYLDFCQEHKGLAQNSLLQIELFVRRFDQFLRGQQVSGWNQLQSWHIDHFVGRQASRNTKRIQRVHKVLRGLFRYLFSQGRLDRDWASALVSPRQYHLARTPRALQADQVLRLLESINRKQPPGKRDFAILLMAASLGVRAGEIAALRLEDLDWKQRLVRFEQSKTRHFLHLPLSRPLREALVDYLEHERPPASPSRNLFLRLTAPRGPLAAGSVSTLLQKRMRQAGIVGSGHQLRHAFARELLRTGIAFPTLQELLGHRQLSSTWVYTKLDLAQLREVADNEGEHY